VVHGWTAPEPPVGYPIISELLYDPIGADDSAEWVEIYNPTDQAVDLSGWFLGDVGPTGEYGSGLYTFPLNSALPADGVLLVARQAEDVLGFIPDFEFVIDPLRDDPDVPNLVPAGGWDGFGFALGNAGDQVILLDATAAPIDALVYGAASYPGVTPHPGVSASGHSLERRPAIYDTDDCSLDFVERYPADPGSVNNE
jgi:glycerophosphoryl diester phosphodiesterase